MPGQSTSLTQRGLFKKLYRDLGRQGLLGSTPVIFCEGDSWFSTPLAMNLLDWIVSPAPQDEEAGVPLLGNGGLFFRAEHSGDHASHNRIKPKRSMFTKSNIKDLLGWFDGFEFDLVLISAGGNDFVSEYLENIFRGKKDLTVAQAIKLVEDSGRFEVVCAAYRLFVGEFLKRKPGVKFLAHTYAYPVRIGQRGPLTFGNVGVAAALKKSVGPWIGPHIEKAIKPNANNTQLEEFVRSLMDGFERNVLRAIKSEFSGNFDYVDYLGELPSEKDWFDEMHPTEAGFHRLATIFRTKMICMLPPAKRGSGSIVRGGRS